MNTLIILLAKLAGFAARFFGGGTSLPGKLALKLNKNILGHVAKGYRVIMVTGTNGKTTTCSMLRGILESSGRTVIGNDTGANMLTGITTCFIAGYRFFAKNKERFAVIETDEAYTRYVTDFVKPEIILVTNLFRDQLDRFGEVYTTWEMIKEAIQKVPGATLVLNGDEAIFGEPGLPNPVVYFGFAEGSSHAEENSDTLFCQTCGSHYRFHHVTFQNLGDYYCPGCGFARPQLTYRVTGVESLTPQGSRVQIDGRPYSVQVPGLYNVYNALSAYSACKCLGVDEEDIAAGLARQENRFGRHETVMVDGHSLHFLLIKNPTGCNGCIRTVTLDDGQVDFVFLLNDLYADGTDISWIWDTAFEELRQMNYGRIFIAGTRRYDMAVRLKAAGLDREKFCICDSWAALTEAIKQAGPRLYVFATYTAMTGYRKELYNRGYIKKLWK